MKPYVDFTEPTRKMEYADEPDKYVTTSKHIRLPYARDVINRSNRNPRQENVSPLLQSFLNASNSKEFSSKLNDFNKSIGTPRVISKTAQIARNEIFRKLGKQE